MSGERPGLALLQRSGGRTVAEVVSEELWYWLEGAVGWIPGRVGRLVRSVVLRPFLDRSVSIDVSELTHIRSPRGLRCGRGVSIGRLCQLTCTGGLTLGDDVVIGPQVIIVTNNHVFDDPEVSIRSQGLAAAPVAVGDDVWIGGHSVILPGVTIGRGAVVAAGAVVRHDVPAMAVMAGVPARVVGHRGAKPEPRADPVDAEAAR